MAQVYLLLYDEKKNVLIAKKHKTWGGKPGIKLHGGGEYCYPGGGLEGGDPKKGALKEFLEETGNPESNITRFGDEFHVLSYSNEGKGTQEEAKVAYYVVFAKVSITGLRVLAATTTIHIRHDYVKDKELEEVGVFSYEEATSIFRNPLHRDTGWFHQPTSDLAAL